jgi:hypothetical protein
MVMMTENAEEEQLLAAYRASDERGRSTTLARAILTSVDYPEVKQPVRLSLVRSNFSTSPISLDAA